MAAEPLPPNPSISSKLRYVDIGINLTDPVYSGMYHGTQRHPNDLAGVLSRARDAGCQKLIITGSDIDESKKAIEMANEHRPATLLSQLRDLASSHSASSSPIVAFGEIGLDYDRLGLCPKDIQLTYFAAQLDIAVHAGLPLFLHSRAAAADFARLLRERLHLLPKRGVVHSFTGTVEEMQELVDMGFDIGINGCSLKTEENVQVVKRVPLERLQLETDGPWCEMRASHAANRHLQAWDEGEGRGETTWKSVKKEKWIEGAMVKGRNESCMIGRVAVAVAGIKGLGLSVVTESAWQNSVRMFGLGER
ncbi:MAG: hypothetical protein M1818_008372 [Claussenomyces sp. TS43310]|nr:MAG: hypothetical protein M1818_008372 [Claussenomyces sp. TS43310]